MAEPSTAYWVLNEYSVLSTAPLVIGDRKARPVNLRIFRHCNQPRAATEAEFLPPL
jgi:hypothetical protein